MERWHLTLLSKGEILEKHNRRKGLGLSCWCKHMGFYDFDIAITCQYSEGLLSTILPAKFKAKRTQHPRHGQPSFWNGVERRCYDIKAPIYNGAISHWNGSSHQGLPQCNIPPLTLDCRRIPLGFTVLELIEATELYMKLGPGPL